MGRSADKHIVSFSIRMLYKTYNAFDGTSQMKLEIKKIGNSTGLILPKELLARLGWQLGDEIFVSEAPDHSIRLAIHDPQHEKVMEIGREVFREYRETFKALAK